MAAPLWTILQPRRHRKGGIRPCWPRLFLASLVLGILLAGPASADVLWTEPLSIELLYFQAIGEADHILVEWETGVEVDFLGFELFKGLSAETTTEKLGFFPGEGDIIGAYYYYRDNNVTPGVTYHYRLVAINIDDSTEEHRASATPGGLANPTATPTSQPTNTPPTPPPAIATNTPTSASPANTATATPTPPATATPTPPATATPTPPATATPTALPQPGAPTATAFPSPAVTATPAPALPAAPEQALPSGSPPPEDTPPGDLGQATPAVAPENLVPAPRTGQSGAATQAAPRRPRAPTPTPRPLPGESSGNSGILLAVIAAGSFSLALLLIGAMVLLWLRWQPNSPGGRR